MDSRAQGPTTPALIEQTIGANLRATAGRHAELEALVSCAQDVRQTYAELDAAVDEIARSGLTCSSRRRVRARSS